MTTDRDNGRSAGQTAAAPTPSCMKPRGASARPAELAGVPAARQPEAAPRRPVPGAPDDDRRPVSSSELTVAAISSGRATARAAVHAALCGVRLGVRDRQFLSRLVNWDKRNAASVASLLLRARQAGRREARLTDQQREIVLAALTDAAVYRAAGRASAFCWECEMVPGSKCGEHAGDGERALSYTQVARIIAAQAEGDLSLAEEADEAGKDLPGSAIDSALPGPSSLAEYRSRAQVAS